MAEPAALADDPFAVPMEIRDAGWKEVPSSRTANQTLEAFAHRVGTWVSENSRDDGDGRYRLRHVVEWALDGRALRSRSYRVFENGSEDLYLEEWMFEHGTRDQVVAHLYFDSGLFADAVWIVDEEGYERLDCDLVFPDGRTGRVRDFFLPVGEDRYLWTTYWMDGDTIRSPAPDDRITMIREGDRERGRPGDTDDSEHPARASEDESRGSGQMPVTTSSPEALRHFEEGRRDLDSFRLARAREHFERALELDPDFVLAVLELAWSQPRFRDMFRLLERAREMAETASITDAERLLVIGDHASANSDPDTWLDATATLVERYPDDARLHYDHGTALRIASRHDEAVAAYRRAIEADPTFGPAYGGMARSLWNLGEIERAETAYRRYAELDPNSPRSHFRLGDFLLARGRFAEAEASYQRALAIEPLFDSAHMGLVTTMMLQEEHDAARQHLAELYERAPHDGFRSGIHFARAVVEADEGDLEGALEELQKNLALSEKIGDTFAMAQDLNNIASVQRRLGRWDDAAASYRRSLQIIEESDHPETRKATRRKVQIHFDGLIALGRDNLARAEELARRYLEAVEPGGIEWQIKRGHDLLGMIAQARGEHDEALAHYGRGNKDSAGIMYRIAQVWEAKGRPEKVREWLGYVVQYRGVLNFGYAFVRKDAERWLAELES